MPKYNITFEVVSSQTFTMPIEAENEQKAEDEGYDKFIHEFNSGDPMPWLSHVSNITIDMISVVPSNEKAD